MTQAEQIEKILLKARNPKDGKATLPLWRQKEIIRLAQELENKVHYLKKQLLELDALNECGVEHWEGYDKALSKLEEIQDISYYPYY